MFKNKKILLAIVLVILLVGGGSYLILGRKSTAPKQMQGQEDQTIGTLTPSDIGLKFLLRDDEKAVKLTITKPQDITYVEYTVSYTRDEKGESVSEGLYGDITPKPGESELSTEFRDLGTCSSGICRYHVITSSLKLVIKITKKDGKQYQVEDTLSVGQ